MAWYDEIFSPDFTDMFNSSVDDFYSNAVQTGLDAAGSTLDPANPLAGALTGTGGTPSWWDSIWDAAKTAGGAATTPGGLSAISGASGLLTNYLGGTASQDASKKALASLQAAYAKAGDASTSQFQTALELGRPYRELGAGLLPTYTAFASGASPGRQTLGQLANGGLYEWQKQQTLDTIDKQMAARGRYDSGAAIRASTDAVNALSAQEAQNQFNRLTTLENMDYGRLSDAMNLGAGFSNQGAGLAVNTGNTLASVYGTGGTNAAAQTNNIGSATKSMYTGLNNAVQGGLNTYNTNQLLNQLGGL